MLPNQMLPTRLDVDHHHKLLSSSILAARKTIPKMVQCFYHPSASKKPHRPRWKPSNKNIQVAFANVGCDEQGDAWTDAIAFLHEFLGFFWSHGRKKKAQERKATNLRGEVETWWVKKSLFFTRIFVGLPVAFPDLNFRKVHVSQVETPRSWIILQPQPAILVETHPTRSPRCQRRRAAWW